MHLVKRKRKIRIRKSEKNHEVRAKRKTEVVGWMLLQRMKMMMKIISVQSVNH